MSVSAIISYLLMKREGARTDDFKPTILTDWQNSKKRKYVLVSVVSVWIIVALWLTREGPWLPRLIGAFFLVLYLIAKVARKSTDTP